MYQFYLPACKLNAQHKLWSFNGRSTNLRFCGTSVNMGSPVYLPSHCVNSKQLSFKIIETVAPSVLTICKLIFCVLFWHLEITSQLIFWHFFQNHSIHGSHIFPSCIWSHEITNFLMSSLKFHWNFYAFSLACMARCLDLTFNNFVF